MAAMVAVSVVTFANADVSVYDVKFQPRTPWNGLVDISYSVACDDPNADIYINPTAYDGDRRITLFPKTLTGDGAESTVKPGKHVLTWDAKKDLGVFAAANFSVKIFAGRRLPRYVVVDLSSGADSANYPVRFSATGPNVSNDICRTTELWLRLVPPGEFWMGSPKDELGRNDDNEDLHHVTLTKPFYMGVFEVTQKQWELVMGEDNTSYFRQSSNAATRPVENTSFGKIRGASSACYPNTTAVSGQSFIGRLRDRTRVYGFDLPSEPRWEYACRAGTYTALNDGLNLSQIDGDANVAMVARYNANSAVSMVSASSTTAGTSPVGCYRPNILGLYDMLGNVSELCRDYFVTNWGTMEESDPVVKGGFLIRTEYTNVKEVNWWMAGRGGTWRCGSSACRSAGRISYQVAWCHYAVSYNTWDDLGFRICAEDAFAGQE